MGTNDTSDSNILQTVTERRLYSFALLKTLINEDRDYLDAFAPFVAKNLRASYQDTQRIRESIEEADGLKFPLHVLRAILNRLSSEGLVEKAHNAARYRLTATGVEAGFDLDTASDTRRRIGSLMEDLRVFLEAENYIIQVDDLREALHATLQQRVDSLIDFITNETHLRDLEEDPGFVRLLYAYIRVASDRKPEHYETMSQLVFGAVVSWVLCTRSDEDLSAVSEFDGCTLYIDTNVLFGILGIDEPGKVEASAELIKLASRYGFTLRAFDFTLAEIASVVNNYISEQRFYLAGVKVNSVYSVLKAQGWGRADVIEFNASLDKRLAALGIDVEQSSVNLQSYAPSNEDWLGAIQQYKPTQGTANRNHDLAALELTASKRGGNVRRPQDARAYFLSADRRLHKFDRVTQQHDQLATVATVMLDEALTSLLWLKDPQVELSVEALLAAHGGGFLIDRNVWRKFVSTLKVLREDGRVDDAAAGALMMEGFLNRSLVGLTDTEAIDEAFVLEKAMQAATHLSKTMSRKDAEKDALVAQHSSRMQELGHLKDDERDRAVATAASEAERKAHHFGYEEGRKEAIAGLAELDAKLGSDAELWGRSRAERWISWLRWMPLAILAAFLGPQLALGLPLELGGMADTLTVVFLIGGQAITALFSGTWLRKPLSTHFKSWKLKDLRGHLSLENRGARD